MKKSLPELDQHCIKILSVLAFGNRKMRFNELHRTLKKFHWMISKPTLSEHLKHLMEKGLVVRTVEDVQNVSYKLNHEKLRHSSSIMKNAKMIEKHLQKERKNFDSLSVNEQVEKVTLLSALRNLLSLKVRIKNVAESDPNKFFDRCLQLTFLDTDWFTHYDKWLIQNCLKDKEYGEKVLETLDKASDEGMNSIFGDYEKGLLSFG